MKYSIRDLFILTTVVCIALVVGDNLKVPFSNWFHSCYNYTAIGWWDDTNNDIIKVWK